MRYAPSVAVEHPSRTAAGLIRRSYRTGVMRARAGAAGVGARLRSGPYSGRAYARQRETTISAVVARALTEFLQRGRREPPRR